MPVLFIREPVNAWTHLGAMFAAIPAAAFLLRLAWGDRVKFYAMLTYSVSLILCFGGSGLFHSVPEAYSEPCRLADHIGIYLLIAGTVTPIGMTVLHGGKRFLLLGGIWVMAATGITLRASVDAPISVWTGLYLGMGWIGCTMYFQLVRRLSHAKVAPMWIGGLLYSAGAAINLFVTFPPQFSGALFGPHEIFHVFVIAGAACHFYFMIAVLIPYRRLPAFPEHAAPPVHAVVPALTKSAVRSGSAVNANRR
jgi:hemolysin III